MISRILEDIATYYEGHTILTIAADFDEAIMGVHEPTMQVVYDTAKILPIIMHKEGCDYLEALEIMEQIVVNVQGQQRTNAPIFIQTKFD